MDKMNESVFKVLVALAESEGALTKQRDISAFTGISLGSVNKAISLLRLGGYIENTVVLCVSEKGFLFLEEKRVRTAIIIAAGFGSRLLPVTMETPKPLVKIYGKPMIEMLIEALRQAEIEKIYVVVGYRADDFSYLKERYAEVELIFNREYTYKNNLSSLHTALDIFEKGNCCVCEADFIIMDPTFLPKYYDSSFYFSKYVEGKTAEWCFSLKGKHLRKITRCGENSLTMIGISYWMPRDASIIAERIREIYNDKSSDNLYWDEVVDQCLDRTHVALNVLSGKEIIEIDTLLELIEQDHSYQRYLEA